MTNIFNTNPNFYTLFHCRWEGINPWMIRLFPAARMERVKPKFCRCAKESAKVGSETWEVEIRSKPSNRKRQLVRQRWIMFSYCKPRAWWLRQRFVWPPILRCAVFSADGFSPPHTILIYGVFNYFKRCFWEPSSRFFPPLLLSLLSSWLCSFQPLGFQDFFPPSHLLMLLLLFTSQTVCLPLCCTAATASCYIVAALSSCAHSSTKGQRK